ncbi:MAG TPA: FAD-binding oxidoreductase [Pirellulales bacterium]|nr:FAD-binding oxidoreductase [Pirellulales bacterium]
MPATQETKTIADVIGVVRDAHDADTPIYPIGGGTVTGFGLPVRRPGIELSLAELNRVVDYPSRDMTITVEAGITMQALAATLAAEGQRLPVDAPQSDFATIGGVVATNTSGPRRYGCGTIRDYVIGISAVDGRGTAFKAGGRVVKNVAGYDFCKLLCGSLGTLAVITQVTFKLKPMPEADAWVICDLPSCAAADPILTELVSSPTTPTAIELRAGGEFGAIPSIAVAFEGSQPEVEWMVEQLQRQWQAQHVEPRVLREREETELAWEQSTRHGVASAVEDGAMLICKFGVLPSRVAGLMQRLVELDATGSFLSQAGNGIVTARFANVGADGSAKFVITRLRPLAHAAGGHVVITWAAAPEQLTRQAIWGTGGADLAVMQAVKQQFDPKNLLNLGRYFFA